MRRNALFRPIQDRVPRPQKKIPAIPDFGKKPAPRSAAGESGRRRGREPGRCAATDVRPPFLSFSMRQGVEQRPAGVLQKIQNTLEAIVALVVRVGDTGGALVAPEEIRHPDDLVLVLRLGRQGA